MQRRRLTARKDVVWIAYLVGAVVFVFAAALVIGFALATVALPWALGVAFVLAILVTALLLPELKGVWERLPR